MKTFTFWYLALIVPGSVLLPLIAGLVNYKKIGRPLRTLLIYLVVTILGNVTGYILIRLFRNNLPGLHVYTAVELVAILYYFKHAFEQPKVSRWLNVFMVGFPLLCIVNFSFFQSINTYNTYTRPLGALIIIITSGIYLATQGSFKNQKLITASGRMVASGFLIYFCSSLFQFIFSNVVHHMASRTIKDVIWNMHATFDLIMFLFFFAAILNERNKR